MRFEFTGKSGKKWKLRVEDKRIASIVKRCADIPGHELFKYLGDDGEPRSVDSGDVNAYIKDITGEDFSAKDFRTWAGTVLAALALAESRSTTARQRPSATSLLRLKAYRNNSAIRRPSAANATCTRRS
ncbi:hypothetical protein [Bradyrhizobium japonicum]|uniref:hypothetical protein n=1 Tax=Bradyrhizobium japonicum TaxID=375 RepID=UPI0027150294|nr:hypothetical protein [Bradyrhizobium japonicum]WLB59236.1 hypothetical protein QIH94_01910 [Bradyrhizobium japonicum]WLB68051.1 hypothetical protein QIH96_43970 [Bradyrhizobium japonicum]